MREEHWKRSSFARLAMIFGAMIAILMAIPATPLTAADMTTVRVQVKDAVSGKPIYQAHLTLRFREQGGFMRRSKIISYTNKTDKNGWGLFPVVPKGVITLMVTAPDHNTFGKEFKITRDNQHIEVKLQKPKPVL